MNDETRNVTDRLKELHALAALLTYARENAVDLGEGRIAEAAEAARMAAVESAQAVRRDHSD
ncbi:MAG: hypothetical protein AAFN79_14215 [Pseudomonadota bacterium]